jgi:ABC-type antimicrobial peptide transport system permease subunit
VIAALGEKIIQVNPHVRVEFRVFEKDIRNRLIREQTMATLSGVFGGLAALLTAVGLYGVISYIVTMRRNEIGIRIALGASRGNVVRIFLRQTLALVAFGVILGLALALPVTQSASSLLFGLRPSDPVTLALASLFLTAVALIASFVPARRATKVDPMVALRYE